MQHVLLSVSCYCHTVSIFLLSTLLCTQRNSQSPIPYTEARLRYFGHVERTVRDIGFIEEGGWIWSFQAGGKVTEEDLWWRWRHISSKSSSLLDEGHYSSCMFFRYGHLWLSVWFAGTGRYLYFPLWNSSRLRNSEDSQLKVCRSASRMHISQLRSSDPDKLFDCFGYEFTINVLCADK